MNISNEVIAVARQELADALGRIRHCVDQLSDDDIWFRPRAEMNSIANILLHVSGNLRQWIVSGIGGAADTRDRPAEFAERRQIAKDELVEKLAQTVRECDAVLAACDEANLQRIRSVQRHDVSGLAAIFHSVSHLIGHAQEIVCITRLRLGEGYRFKGRGATSH
jgi:hypothetical protein